MKTLVKSICKYINRMTKYELETGLYLDLPLQIYIKKVTEWEASTFMLIDENHGEENLKYFSLIANKIPAYKHKTIFNPPLEKGSLGTNSTNNTSTSFGTGFDILIPIIGTKEYRMSFYRFKNYDLIRIQNITDDKLIYLFNLKYLDFWTTQINLIKKDFYY
jgi:hypothetical protein